MQKIALKTRGTDSFTGAGKKLQIYVLAEQWIARWTSTPDVEGSNPAEDDFSRASP